MFVWPSRSFSRIRSFRFPSVGHLFVSPQSLIVGPSVLSSSSLFQLRSMSDKSAPVCNDEFCLPSSAPAAKSSTANVPAGDATSTGKKVVKIDITSDTVCPWCFVGKRRLDKALKQVDSSKVDVQIQWHPFQLNPSSPEISVPKMDFYTKRFGSRAPALMANMKNVGLEENIHFQYSDKGRIGNTLKSHQLLTLAYQLGGVKLQNELCERLFQDYFEKEEDITKDETLISAAKSVGITEQQAKDALHSSTIKKTIEKELEHAHSQDISGVPHFVIDGKYAVGGAQEPAVFLNIFKKLGITSASGAL